MANFKAILLLSLTICSSYVNLTQSITSDTNNDIGVCYGLLGDNLPSPRQVVNLYKNNGFTKMRIYEPYHEVLDALRGSGIRLVLGVRNQDIPVLASGEEGALSWFMTHVKPYVNDVNITYISVGNEVVPGEFSESILPAMQNLQNVLRKHNLGTKATTVVHAIVLGSSYPPSAGQFTDAARPFMTQIIRFLSTQQTPLFVNLYTYFPYASDPINMPIDYVMLSSSQPTVQDENLSYTNLLDAMIDAFYWAMEKEGVSDVDIVVSETGWPHAGGASNITTPEFAAMYNRNLIKHISKGDATPKKPNAHLEGYIFSIFDEDLKDQGVEQHWGLFNPSMQPNYLTN